MSIQTLKEIAEVNDKLQKAAGEYKTVVEGKVGQIIAAAVRDFTERMKENGFVVSRSAADVTARYHGTTVVLHLPAVSDRPIGAVTAFRLSQTGKPLHIIVAMHEWNAVSIFHGNATAGVPDELATATGQLAEVQQRIKSYPAQKIVYRAQQEDDKSSIESAEAHDTFLEALRAIIG